MNSVDTLLKALKSRRIIADLNAAKNCTYVESVILKKPTDVFIRDAITGLGTILTEELDDHYYISSIKTGMFGNTLSYAIIVRSDSSAEIAVYAQEGWVKRGLAKNAMAIIKKALC